MDAGYIAFAAVVGLAVAAYLLNRSEQRSQRLKVEVEKMKAEADLAVDREEAKRLEEKANAAVADYQAKVGQYRRDNGTSSSEWRPGGDSDPRG